MEVPLLLVALIAPLLIAGSLFLWRRIIAQLRCGKEPVTFESRRPTHWGVVEVVLIAGGYILLQSMAGSWFDAYAETPDKLRRVLSANLCANLLTAIWTLLVLRVRGSNWTDLGLRLHRLAYDIKLGLLAFVVIAPPVYAIQGLLKQWFPGEHPVEELLHQPMDTATWIVVFLAVVVVAPLVEELLFRVVLQGWLEKTFTRSVSSGEKSTIEVSPADPMLELDATLNRLAERVPETVVNPYVAPSSLESSFVPRAGPREGATSWLAIPFSSLVFAMIHLRPESADPVPLFVFALMLGYLYQQSHRIWPGVVLHATLNGISLLMLALARQ